VIIQQWLVSFDPAARGERSLTQVHGPQGALDRVSPAIRPAVLVEEMSLLRMLEFVEADLLVSIVVCLALDLRHGASVRIGQWRLD
jgi:hypothetical protein